MKKLITIIALIGTMLLTAQNPVPEWSKTLTIYEVNIRQYTPEGTFEAFTEHIPRLKELGVGILWLMPVQPIGEENRKGSLGSYYSISDYITTNPEFGSMVDFKKLVDEAHNNGMYVILDWVGNHTSWDHVWMKDHKDYYSRGNDGKMMPPVPDWTDVVDLNFDNQAMHKAMIEDMKFWLSEGNIDGFRCDVAMMIPNDFWQTAFTELRKIKPDLFLLCEAEGPQFIEAGFDMGYAWQRHHAMNQIAKGKKRPADLDSLIRQDLNHFPAGSCYMNFTSNHDENSWNGTEFERMGDGAKTFAVISATIPGMLLIYSGQEVALDRRLRFFEKDTIQWLDDRNFTQFYSKLNEIKKENPALWNGKFGGSYKMIDANNVQVYCFLRQSEDGTNKVMVIANCTGASQKIRITSQMGKYRNAFSGKKVKLKNEFEMEMGPWQYLIFTAH